MNNDIQFSIGDIVWAIIKDSEIYPLRVCEEVTKKTLSGTETVYYVENHKKRYSIEDLSSEGITVWASLSELEEYLLKQFNDSLQVKINKAKEFSRSWFGVHQQVAGVPNDFDDDHV